MPSSNLPSVLSINDSRGSSAALGPYSFRDKNYQRLFPPDLHFIQCLLAATCHSQDRLRKEGYVLPDDLQSKSHGAKIHARLRRQCLSTPIYNPFFPKRKAVALDCEMAGVKGGRSEVISICVVDFFTGELLIKSLVKQRESIVDWRSDIHGILPSTMSVAVGRGQTLDGWETTREELWKHVNENTVIVGQSLQHDLKALRVVHANIVDTAIITADAVFGGHPDDRGGRRWGLQLLCQDLLHLQIRQGSGIHDDVEDTMAAREVALWYLCYPTELQKWANKARKSFHSEREENKRRTQQSKARAPRRIHYYGTDYDEHLRWEDVMDWDLWPKSPPDSD
ncbi:hypothetical protein AK830_g10343 [Neonectria ditissima]|uniref:Exonuclease domain-containing protein n=1 Tax=Neonectria ditissima TaxID=78410 RepID=A0A0P7B6L8_9HYPO|nr:hypothetical protein AK830_g10343 [Neonectria ditissima]